MIRKSLASASTLLLVGLVLVACTSDSSTTTSSPGGSSSGTVPQIDAGSFTADFSVMAQLKDLAAQGEGMIGVLLPDTTTSTRYVQYDKPLLSKAFEAAGLTPDQYKIDNAQGSASTMQTQAEADINAGASVLLIDPIDTGSGAAIESKATDAGLKVIDYDRLVTGGPPDRYYVSFNNVQVGELMGQGLVDCITAWNVKDPNILVMDGDPTDNNAKLFAQGYNGVLKKYFDDGTYTKVGEPAGSWDPDTTANNFEQQFTAHPEINAVITPNDDNANAVISILKKNKIQANTFPTTGQDASPPGLQNILAGYQCGTVYKPFYAEAQAAAALAIMLRAGVTPPDSLVNDTTTDDQLKAEIASVYTTPVWTTIDNIAAVTKDDATIGIGPVAKDVCTPELETACKDAGIT
jgi:D-xylose transport system substrate-binding protein